MKRLGICPNGGRRALPGRKLPGCVFAVCRRSAGRLNGGFDAPIPPVTEFVYVTESVRESRRAQSHKLVVGRRQNGQC